MICNECGKNEATYHSIKKINGKTTETHLCGDCQRTMGFNIMKLSNFGDIFSSFVGGSVVGRNNSICKACGTTSKDFLKSGYVGCSHCYESFRELINSVLERVQQGTRHLGKAPVTEATGESEYDMVERELNRAVAEERYDDAAVLNARRKKLREEHAND